MLRRMVVIFFLGLVLGAWGLPFNASDSAGSGCASSDLALNEVWSDGVISDGIGLAGIYVADFDGDGQSEILAATYYSAFLLRYSGSGYSTVWMSPSLYVSKVAAGDLDGDGIPEIVVGTTDGHVDVFHGGDFSPMASIKVGHSTGDAASIKGLAVDKVDGTGRNAIIAVNSDSAFVYDGQTLSLEWEASGKGGTGVAIGDLYGDGRRLIVVNGSMGHVLDAVEKSELWGYAGGFGSSFDVGDVDGDGKAEVAFVQSNTGVNLLDMDTQTITWQITTSMGVQAVKIADVDGDGIPDVIAGDYGWGQVHVYRGSDGTELASMPCTEYGASGIGVGDCDGDGSQEVLWGSGLGLSGKDALLVGDPVTGSVKWEGEDLDGPFHVAVADLDDDGTPDIVAASTSSDNSYNGGEVRVYNGRTHQVEWTIAPNSSFDKITQVAVGQLDSDPALEIVVGRNNWYDTVLTAYDGVTHQEEWTSPTIGQNGPIQLAVRDLDGDGKDEIIVALDDRKVYVFAGASNVVKWQSDTLTGYIRDFAIGDIDGDGVLDIAVLTDSNLYIFNAVTYALESTASVQYATHVGILPASAGGGGIILYSHQDGYNEMLTALDPSTLQPLWDYPLGSFGVSEISGRDVDGDGMPDIIVTGGGSAYSYGHNPSLLLVGKQSTTSGFCPIWQSSTRWGGFINAVIADLDGDNTPKIVLGGDSGVQVWDTAPDSGSCDVFSTASASVSSGNYPLSVDFTGDVTNSGCSWGATYSWDFGDGGTSTDLNPSHTYGVAGTYLWKFKVEGYQRTILKTGIVEVTAPPCTLTCYAGASPSQGPPPLTVNYTATASPSNCSSYPTYHWDFGDGVSSDSRYPSHTYTAVGTYSWTMTATLGDTVCTKTGTVDVTFPPCNLTLTAQNSADSGAAPLNVGFAATIQACHCSGALTYTWTFGDGATVEGPVAFHTYTTPGSYNWALAVSSDGASWGQTGTITVFRTLSISSAMKKGSPFRIVLTGEGFDAQPAVTIGDPGTEWTQVSYKSATKMVLKGGADLKALFPAGQPVTILLINGDGGTASISYTMP